jgi:hypothetical protein
MHPLGRLFPSVPGDSPHDRPVALQALPQPCCESFDPGPVHHVPVQPRHLVDLYAARREAAPAQRRVERRDALPGDAEECNTTWVILGNVFHIRDRVTAENFEKTPHPDQVRTFGHDPLPPSFLDHEGDLLVDSAPLA